MVWWTIAPYLLGTAAALVPTPRADVPWVPYARGFAEFMLGATAVWLIASYSPWSQMLVATAVVAGRQFPLIRGEGSKGLMVGLGALFTINPVGLALWTLLWGIGFVTTGYRTAGIAAGTLFLPLALGILAGWAFAGMAVPVCVLLLDRQRGDLRRMFLGAEPKHYWQSDA